MVRKVIAALAFAMALTLGEFCADAANVMRITSPPSTTQRKAPAVNVFQLAGTSDRFILLDSDEDGFLVFSCNGYAKRPWSQKGELSAFDPNNEDNIAWWLNNTFLTDTSIADRLPDMIIDNLQEYTWRTEGGGPQTTWTADYDITCKLVFMSQTQWSKYNAKFGYADDERLSYWYLRTTRGQTGNPLVACINSPNTGVTGDGKPGGTSSGTRVLFRLPKDFFRNAALSIDKSGDNIIALIKEEHKKQPLTIYTQAEISKIMNMSIAPYVENLTTKGSCVAGDAYIGTYKYVSADGTAENGTRLQWMKSKTLGGVWSTIPDATSISYVPDEDDVGYFLKLRVTPATLSTVGTASESLPTKNTVSMLLPPYAENIRIKGEPIVGKTLEAIYHFVDQNGDICSGTDYKWQISDDNSTFTDIENGANSRFIKISGAESGKFIRVVITPNKREKTIAGKAVASSSLRISDVPEIKSVKILGNAVNVYAQTDGNELNICGTFGEPCATIGTTLLSQVDAFPVTHLCKAEYKWQICSQRNGVYKDIFGASGDSYTVTPFDAGKQIRLVVHYVDADEISGSEFFSLPMHIDAEYKEHSFNGENKITASLEPEKTMAVWLKSSLMSAFVLSVKSDVELNITSDNYCISTVKNGNIYTVTGALAGNLSSGSDSIRAIKITAAAGAEIELAALQTSAIADSGNIEHTDDALLRAVVE